MILFFIYIHSFSWILPLDKRLLYRLFPKCILKIPLHNTRRIWFVSFKYTKCLLNSYSFNFDLFTEHMNIWCFYIKFTHHQWFARLTRKLYVYRFQTYDISPLDDRIREPPVESWVLTFYLISSNRILWYCSVFFVHRLLYFIGCDRFSS